MRIALNVSRAVEPHTGVGAYCINIVRRLAELDTVNKYDLYVPWHTPEYDALPNNFTQIVSTKTYPLISAFDKDFTNSEAFRSKRYDLVHIFFFEPPDGYASLPIIYTVHDIIPALTTIRNCLNGTYPWKMFSPNAFKARRREPKIYAKAKRIIAISETTKRDIARVMRIPEERIDVIYNGADEDLKTFIPDDRALDAYSLRKKEYIIYFGGHTARKNVRRLAEAHTMLPEETRKRSPLVIVGTGGTERATRKAFPNDPYILYTGKLPRQELFSLVAHAYLSAYVSLYEGFGLPLIEAALLRVPTIASDTPALKEALSGAAEYVSPYSATEMKDAFERLIANPVLRDRLAEKARAKAITYSWKEAAGKILSLYEHTAREARLRSDCVSG